jgi:hypothetical protein
MSWPLVLELSFRPGFDWLTDRELAVVSPTLSPPTACYRAGALPPYIRVLDLEPRFRCREADECGKVHAVDQVGCGFIEDHKRHENPPR